VSLRRSVASAQAAKAKNPPGLSPGGFPLALARDLRRPRVGQGLGSTSARMEPGLGPHLVGELKRGFDMRHQRAQPRQRMVRKLGIVYLGFRLVPGERRLDRRIVRIVHPSLGLARPFIPRDLALLHPLGEHRRVAQSCHALLSRCDVDLIAEVTNGTVIEPR
jgi:hypothetical protein